MARPALELADILRKHGPGWCAANRGHISLGQFKAMSAIETCRTAALGGHVAACENLACGHTHVAYNSCLMCTSSNGELTRLLPHFPVHRRAFTLHYTTPPRSRRLGHCRPITSGDDHVGDLHPGIEDAGTSAQRAKRAVSRRLRSD